MSAPDAGWDRQDARQAADAAMLMRYHANRKSAVVAYVLWFFLGYLGAHRFYLGRAASGAAMLFITVVSTILTVVLIGHAGLALVGLWWIIDAFLIPGMTGDYNNRLIAELGG